MDCTAYPALLTLYLLLWISPLLATTDSESETALTVEDIAQKMCPVRPKEAILPEISSIYEGEPVYFCCYSCRKRFAADPSKYLTNLPRYADDDYAHSHEHSESHHQGIARLVHYFGKFHPLVVHFPIALILVAALGELLFITTAKPYYAQATRFCLSIAALAAVVTVALGWAAGYFENFTGQEAETLTLHRWLGTAGGTLIIIVALLSIAAQQKKSPALRTAYRFGIFIAAGLIGVTGHYGAMLVFGWNHFAW